MHLRPILKQVFKPFTLMRPTRLRMLLDLLIIRFNLQAHLFGTGHQMLYLKSVLITVRSLTMQLHRGVRLH